MLICFFSTLISANEADFWNTLIFFQKDLDSRTEIFDLTSIDIYDDNQIVFKGIVSERQLMVNLLALLNAKSLVYSYQDKTTLAQSNQYGLVIKPTVNLFNQPEANLSVISQLIFGEPVSIIKQQNDWFYVQGADRYLGWLKKDNILTLNAEEFLHWQNADKYLVQTKELALKTADTNQIWQHIPHGSILAITNTSDEYYSLYLPNSELIIVNPLGLIAKQDQYLSTALDIIETAKLYWETPYLWGGAAIYGADCSGFVQRVLNFNNIYYPRDSDQQYNFGTLTSLDDLEKGDLVFFSTYRAGPSHIGIYLGDKKYIHAGSQAGQVSIDSFDPQSSNYNSYLHHRFINGQKLNYNRDFLASWR